MKAEFEICVDGKDVNVEFLSELDNKRIIAIKNGRPFEILLNDNGGGAIEFHIGAHALLASYVDDKDIKKMKMNK